MTTDKNTATITVLGTGLIGAAVARNLKRRGFNVHAWNRTPAKAQALTPDGIKVFDTPLEAVRGSDIIITVLKDGPGVLEVMKIAAPDLSKEAIWLQLSTVGIQATDELAAFAAQRGLVFYDTPVLGTRQPAEQGQLLILASGPLDAREKIQPVFDAIGKRTLWVAEHAGAGSRLKLVINSWLFALTHGTAECLALAKVLGVDPALVIDLVKNSQLNSDYFQLKAAAILADNYTTNFSIANASKDAQLVVDAAEQAGIQMDLTAAGLRRFQRAIDAGYGDKDIAASYLA